MAKMRKARHAITRAEIDPERIGIAVPIVDEHGRVLGSLSYVVPASEERAVARLVSVVATAAREVEENMKSDSSLERTVREEAA